MSTVDFFGRTGELETLQDAYESPTAEMAIIYGRRRIGKTALIRKFCEGKSVFFYTARAWKDDFQLEEFSQVVGAFNRNPQQRFLDWPAALRALTVQPCDTRRVVVIDEFQYIAKERPSILSELQVLWDEELSRKNLFLILCGSAVSFIAKEVLGEKNPLYGRARTIMKVRPLPFATAAQFVPDCTADDVFRAYAVLGGIPYFWQGMNPRRSLTENLATIILREGGFLNDEAQSVLRQEFRDPATYNAILQAIAFGATTRTEIVQKSLADSRNLSKYLTALENMGLIERECSVFSDAGDLTDASKGLYRIPDHYLKFWFRFLAKHHEPVMTQAEAVSEWHTSVEPFFSEFASEAFEEVCRQYLVRLQHAGQLPFRPTELGRWLDKNAEIDIVAADHERRHCLVGECKYRNEKVGLKVFRSLQAKCARLPVHDDAVFHYWLFSRSGFEDPVKALAERDPYLHLVGMDELLDAAVPV